LAVQQGGTVYAIVRTGGKQYRVEEGQLLRVERLPGAAGDSVTLDEVLLVATEAGTRVGSPRVAGASVLGKVLEQGRGAKLRVFHYKKRKHFRKTRGHRQDFTALRIEKIQA
jgi:large subunit ribosomal protein L21